MSLAVVRRGMALGLSLVLLVAATALAGGLLVVTARVAAPVAALALGA